MSMHSAIVRALGLALCLVAGPALADGPGLGQPLKEIDIAVWDISIEPDGKGLPPGSGTPAQGGPIFAEKRAACHGPEGKGGVTGVTAAPLPPLVGGGPITDISAAMKRIANFWPYSTTLFDRLPLSPVDCAASNGRLSAGSKIGAKRKRSNGANYGESHFLRHAYLLGNQLPL